MKQLENHNVSAVSLTTFRFFAIRMTDDAIVDIPIHFLVFFVHLVRLVAIGAGVTRRVSTWMALAAIVVGALVIGGEGVVESRSLERVGGMAIRTLA